MNSKPEDLFDMSFFIDDDLKEVPNNFTDMLKGIEMYKEIVNGEADIHVKGKMLSKLGFYYNTVEMYDESEKNLLNAIMIFNINNDAVNTIIAEIRLSRTFQNKGKLTDALNILTKLENTVDEDFGLEDYRDFIYQHKGKVLYDMEKYDDAIKYFNSAMKIRKKKDNGELISSTQQAIDAVKKKVRETENKSDPDKH